MKNLFFLCFLLTTLPIAAASLTRQAADFICEIETRHNLNRLAVFAVTNIDGEEIEGGSFYSTALLSALSTCPNLTLTDKSKEEDIFDGQAFAQTGTVDEKSMVPAGQLVGADSLLFGILRDSGLELRLLDARTGQLLGAQIFTNSGGTLPGTYTDDDYYTKRWLVDSVRSHPSIYLYVTSSARDWNILCAQHPYLERAYSDLRGEQQIHLNALRDRIDQLRGRNGLPKSHNQQFRRDAVLHDRERMRQHKAADNPRLEQIRSGKRLPRRQGSGGHLQGISNSHRNEQNDAHREQRRTRRSQPGSQQGNAPQGVQSGNNETLHRIKPQAPQQGNNDTLHKLDQPGRR